MAIGPLMLVQRYACQKEIKLTLLACGLICFGANNSVFSRVNFYEMLRRVTYSSSCVINIFLSVFSLFCIKLCHLKVNIPEMCGTAPYKLHTGVIPDMYVTPHPATSEGVWECRKKTHHQQGLHIPSQSSHACLFVQVFMNGRTAV